MEGALVSGEDGFDRWGFVVEELELEGGAVRPAVAPGAGQDGGPDGVAGREAAEDRVDHLVREGS